MTWNTDQGTYLTGQEKIDSLDLVAIDCERKWGCDRLRLLVSEDLRAKFDSQRLRTNEAIINGTLDDVIRETRRMALAWRTLDAAAESSKATNLPPTIWEVTLPDGRIAAIVRETEHADLVANDGRAKVVFTLEEVGRLLGHLESLWGVKTAFPGAIVTKVRQSIADPLDGIEQRGNR